ncbi:filamentous hemagglutinin family protein [Bradyrhizobium diazoefficiens]|nr:filamentous haemagglutinin family protein [Bradyrhizobium diazoefficiens]MBR0964138.1 filamentous hemagglutinin family protein [Bradyrhizobium diazoefficiens]MBR0978298.1 filamentous hemagglutinin family protein [Bradyrhizobium diazoefficiens]MBR1006229.1 filamentous hemagglutinin family protein [Bradyrhizobium diazoefficiens]MBR1014281.1 filamentous hemagglutinin family protein [Bradyrhizobium diazoefficiens]MBR1050418.1 filamentous hemagglutinin family protein [Bradyrhizobium diazoefficie
MRRAFERSLLCGVSLVALSLASGFGHARNLTPGDSSVAPTAAAQQAAIQAALQSAGAASQAEASLVRAAAALAAARKLQTDAAAAARAAGSSVPNGLVTGGLMPYGGTSSDPLAGIKVDPSKWTGANAPVQTSSGSNVTVNIQQTQQKSILYWDTFNVGANTTVNFQQSASDWIALNRVQDPSASPSRILGQINAMGGVYLINRNGIIFGAGSQVNVHTLIASSLDVGKLGDSLEDRDKFFKDQGIANLNSFSIYDKDGGAATNLIAGDVKVERGASITGNILSDQVSLGSPGSVYLFGANVTNSGSITANGGEVAMVAARTIDVVPNGYSVFPDNVLGKDSSGKTIPFVGREFRLSQFAASYQTRTDDTTRPLGYPIANKYLSGTGAVFHDGVIDAARGIVVMNGDTVTVGNPTDANGHALTDSAGKLLQGVISVDTSIDRNSFVLLRAATSVTMNGVISSLPVDDGAAGLPSTQSFTPAYIEASAQTNVTVGATGLVSAPSAQVSLNAKALPAFVEKKLPPGLFQQGMSDAGTGGNSNGVASNSQDPQSVLLAPGATIDVAGLQNVELPASYNVIAVKLQSEFADSPLQRPPYATVNADGTGVVYGQTLWIDIRNTGTRSDGTTWVGTPLADASGYVAKVPRSIYQLMTVGGSMSLNTDLTTDHGGGGVQTAGSVMNVAGGSVKFQSGMVNTTRLIGSDGRIYDISKADPNMTYVGIAGQYVVNHSRWGVTEYWSSQSKVYSTGYTEGHDAGSVSLVTVNPSLLGTMYFGSTAGERQISNGQLPLQGSLALTTPSSVQIGAAASANYTTASSYTTNLSDEILSSYGLSSLSLTANDFVLSSGSTLNLAAGGSLSVTAGAIDIAGTVSAAGGSVSLTTDQIAVGGTAWFKPPTNKSGGTTAANIFVEGAIDVSGRFVNDIGRVAAVDASGPAFINGGKISMATTFDSASVSGGYIDTTGSILLAKGSLLDVSSGGYISPQGKARTVSSGVMEGKAGSISLALYSHGQWEDTQGPHHPTPGVATPAVIKLDGTLRGYGFESNGSLRLAGVNTIRIGGSASTLPQSLLTGGGFGSYTIEAVTDQWSGATSNVIVSAGTSLTLQQQNFVTLADYTAVSTGTKLGQQANVQVALLPDNQRKAVDLTLKADNILLDTGSKIVTDPKANITLAAVISNRNGLKPTDALWTVASQSVELRGTIIDHGGSVFINSKSTHLSSEAKVDLSGTFVANDLFGTVNGPTTSGSYIAGGSFTVEAGTLAIVNGQTYYAYSTPSGYLVADAGASVDVSGAAGTIQIANARGAVSSQWSWSDAGTVSADVSGFAWGGSFAAAGGRYGAADGSVQSDARANGGTILLGGGGMLLRQDTTDVSNALAAYRAGSAPGALVVSADQLAPFDNVYLYAASAQGGAARIFTDLPGTIYGEATVGWGGLFITGPLNWTVTNRLEIAAGAFNAPTSGAVDAHISAAYVLLAGSDSARVAGTSTLTVNAQTIDLQGAPNPTKAGDPVKGLDFSGFSQVNLIASGDIRLGTLKVADGLKTSNADTTPTAEQSAFTGNLVTAADLLFSAQRIYPVTAVTFGIETPGNVKFAAPAGSDTTIPLSAGGGITVHAKTIEQAGNLFAPLGTITLGSTDSSVSTIITQSVVLAPGSLTSVSLADTTVPYGATSDGTDWYYNANLKPLSAPPSKGLILAGSNVTRSDGSTIDLRGGGDLQAIEFIQGKGGSHDVLAGQNVYALVPTRGDTVAAYDIHFATARSADNGATITAGDSVPLVGQQITIDGGNGIPAGTYTLYPAHYATLPGAMRVTVYASDNNTKHVTSGTKLPDGTVLVTGNYTQSTAPGKQSSGQTVFAVQTSAVWQQYSEYSFTGANSYYTQLAAKQNTAAPRLPMDAGRLSVSALETIVLNGMALTQPGLDSSGNTGRGGELDISAPKLAVVGHAGYVDNDVPAGYVGLDVTQLNGFESVLIGGSRSDFANGTLITPTASNVVVDTRGEAFTAPEILLVAKVGEWQELKQQVTVGSSSVTLNLPVYVPVDGSGTVTVKSGSIIETTGAVHSKLGRNYVVVSDGQAPVTAASLAAALGGTLSGTEILGADLTKLTGADSAALQALAYYANGGPQQPGRGALFVASNDPSLQITGPTKTGVSTPALTIKFANVGANQVSGSLNLAGGDTSANGRVVVADGARITTNTLTLQGTASNNAIAVNTTDLHASLVNLVAPTIGIGTANAVSSQSLVVQANSAQFADVQTLALRAFAGPITVYGDFNSGTRNLTLDANGIALGLDGGAAQDARISASGTISLTNTAGPAFSGNTAANGNSLQFAAKEIDLGSGVVNGVAPATYMTIAGYSNVGLTATDRVLVKGPGMLTLGVSNTEKVDLTVTTPSVLVAGASGAKSQSFGITGYAGNVTIQDSFVRDGVTDRPADSTEVGGSLQITASNITVASTIQAQGGTITLNAVAGNLELKSGAYLAAGGYKKTLVDVDTYAPGGKVLLNADIGTSFLPLVPGAGRVLVDARSVIDVAQPAGGLGYGGEIDVNALRGGATIAGSLRGAGSAGLGGRFKLDTKDAADLTALADTLIAGGLTGSIDIHTRTGNLELQQGHTLKANAITLTADDAAWDSGDASKQFGQVKIRGLVDATGYGGTTADGTGQAGGQVALYGANSVFLASSGVIDASTTHTDERGGDVTIGIGWSANSKIWLQQGTQINVSGGTKGGLSGGTVTFRAPLDGNNDVKIAAISNVANSAGTHGSSFYADGAKTYDELPVLDATNNVNDRTRTSIVGARSVAVNGFIAFDTKGGKNGIDGSSLGWFGTIDTSGWYKGVDTNGNLIPATTGSWTNVSGFTLNPSSVFAGFSGVPTTPASVRDSTGQVIATINGYVMGLNGFSALPPSDPGFVFDGSTTYKISFEGGAQGTVTTLAFGGFLNIVITNPGSGYTTTPTWADITRPDGQTVRVTPTRSSLKILSAQINLVDGFAGYSGGTPSNVTIVGAGGVQVLSFVQRSNFSGQTVVSSDGTTKFAPDTPNFIPLKSSGVYDPFNPATQGTAGIASFTGGAGTGSVFFGDIVSQISTISDKGPWSYNGQSYGFSNLFTRLAPLVTSLGADVVHVQPGVDLVNSNGDITVNSNWNLAAGIAGGLKNGIFDLNSSYINFKYRLATPWGGLDAGALTLRATGNINVNASISDGFFQFGNYLGTADASGRYFDENTITRSTGAYTYYLNTPGNESLTAPYNAAANGISPTSLDLAAADLFPHSLLACTTDCSAANIKTITTPSSWSYKFTAGADVSSANVGSRVSLANGIGDVIVDKHASYTQTLVSDTAVTTLTATVHIPTMIRTGTGNINIAAAQDVILKDTSAPGVIYAAGVNTATYASPYTVQTTNGTTTIVVTDPDGFYEPRVLGYGNAAAKDAPDLYYGPPTAAAFPEKGGDVVIDAQRDVIGNVTVDKKVPQYYQPWLLSNAAISPSGSAAIVGAGVFAPVGGSIASQTAWWLQYGSFQQGFLSAGGNISVLAGHDLVDVSVSAPTTGRVTGGLAAGSTPVTHVYGSGNMIVRAGGDILGGAFYEGSGHARIEAAGDIRDNGTIYRYASSKLKLPDLPQLAVDTGQMILVAGGSVAVAGVVNPAALHAQPPSAANPLTGGVNSSLYFDTYGPDSKVSLLAKSGDVTIGLSSPTIKTDIAPGAAAAYPASFEAIALQGNLITTGISDIRNQSVPGFVIPAPGIVLSASDHGTFDLLAAGNIDLTFGYPQQSSSLLETPRPVISAGPALFDAAFDPYRPNSGNSESSSRAVLAHADDAAEGRDTTARIYAASGNITATGRFGLRTSNETLNVDPQVYQRIEINRPASIYAGGKIVDLNIIVQNIHVNDVSKIVAGGDITYTGYANGGGIQVAGPGHLMVQAGGDIGPFLPAAFDNATQAPVQEGIVSVGNSSANPVGNVYIASSGASAGSIGIYNESLLGPRNNQRRNAALTEAAGTRQGASIDVLFGVKFGIDYDAMISKYFDPASPTFLATVKTTDPVTGEKVPLTLEQFKSLPTDLQHVLVDEAFFGVLKEVGKGTYKTSFGYAMIDTMFPAKFGYTANALGGGANGASQLVKTGDMNLLHATVQTKLGGDVSIFGPGGSLIVGSLAAESNTALKLRDIGILTLGGGAINTFTDANVLVNSSRVLTTQGGDVTMWSSNGNLDAGRGSKTTLSAPALQVLYDQDDYQSIDLGGFVTGAGIGTLKASSVAVASDLYLLAPRGTIDFGTAGVQSSGNAIIVAPVVANYGNSSVQGSTTGVPTVSVPNIGALTAGSNTAGAAAKTADTPTAGGNSKPASIFIVEVIGYGGGDGQSQGQGQGEQSEDKKQCDTTSSGDCKP